MINVKFYEMLVKYYDDIFPMNDETYSFIRQDLIEGDKVLDVACGTGTYTLPLQKEGILAFGVDLEESMIEVAEEKAKKEGIRSDFVVASMLNLDLVSDGDLRRIFIIGNSLVHLKSLDEIRTFIMLCYELLMNGGDLIIQIINYDKILDNDIKSLPTIEVPEKGVTFSRYYYYDLTSHSIEFASKLTVNGEVQESSVYLFPLRKDELIKELENAGFKDIETYKNFKGEPYEKEAMPLIVKARK